MLRQGSKVKKSTSPPARLEEINMFLKSVVQTDHATYVQLQVTVASVLCHFLDLMHFGVLW